MKITWYGTATIGIDDGKTRLLFDPFVRMNKRIETTPVEGFAGFDAVLVTHGHFTVNGHKADIPSMEIKAGDVIAVKEKSQKSPKFKEIKEMSITVPAWMTVDIDKLEGKVVAVPRREEIDTPIAEHLIVELYSK